MKSEGVEGRRGVLKKNKKERKRVRSLRKVALYVLLSFSFVHFSGSSDAAALVQLVGAGGAGIYCIKNLRPYAHSCSNPSSRPSSLSLSIASLFFDPFNSYSLSIALFVSIALCQNNPFKLQVGVRKSLLSFNSFFYNDRYFTIDRKVFLPLSL